MCSLISSALVSVAVAMLTFVLQYILRENMKLKREKEEAAKKRETALELGVLGLLRVKLIEYHTKYMEQKSISTHGYENWTKMYDAYKELGGNGMVEHMNEDIEELNLKS